MSRNFLACMFMLGLLLAASGITGALKYSENLELKRRYQALEVEKNKYEAVARKIQDTERDESAVRKLLGLQWPEGATEVNGQAESAEPE